MVFWLQQGANQLLSRSVSHSVSSVTAMPLPHINRIIELLRLEKTPKTIESHGQPSIAKSTTKPCQELNQAAHFLVF